jgi:hypothetical protein
VRVLEQEVLELQEVVPDLASLALLACPSSLAVGTGTVRQVLGSVYTSRRYLHVSSRRTYISWKFIRMTKMKRLTCGERRWDLSAIGIESLFRS